MARLKLNPDATFKAKVAVPVPGGTADVLCEFKYRDAKALRAYSEAHKDDADVDAILACVVGWDLDDAFDADSVEQLCNAYPGAAFAILSRYHRELLGIREGN